MITEHDLKNWFTYHTPNDTQIPRYKEIREAAHAFASVIINNTPAGPDQTVAVRKVREAVMVANQSIACSGE